MVARRLGPLVLGAFTLLLLAPTAHAHEGVSVRWGIHDGHEYRVCDPFHGCPPEPAGVLHGIPTVVITVNGESHCLGTDPGCWFCDKAAGVLCDRPR